MIISIDGVEYRSNIVGRDSKVSKHTDRALQQVEVQIVVRGKPASDELLSKIEASKLEDVKSGTTSIFSSDGDDRKWHVNGNRYSYNDQSPFFTHTVTLKEVEDLKIERLQIGDLIVEPYEYEERFNILDGLLQIEAKAVVSPELFNQLDEMQQQPRTALFPVVRYGINERPIEMRLGLSYWSPEGANRKQEIYLYEPEPDDTNKLAGTLGWVRSMRDQTAKNKDILSGLIDLLESKEIITSEEIAAITLQAEEKNWDSCIQFYKRDDIDND